MLRLNSSHWLQQLVTLLFQIYKNEKILSYFYAIVMQFKAQLNAMGIADENCKTHVQNSPMNTVCRTK